MLGQGLPSSVFAVKSFRSVEDKVLNLEASKCIIKLLHLRLLEKPSMLAACATDLTKEGFILGSLDHEHILCIQAWAKAGLSGAFVLVLEKIGETLSNQLGQWQRRSSKIRFSLNQQGVKKTNFLNKHL